jgi:hypothetical protein
MKVLLPIILLALVSSIAWMAWSSGERDNPTIVGPGPQRTQNQTTPNRGSSALSDKGNLDVAGPSQLASDEHANETRHNAATRVIEQATARGELAVYVLAADGKTQISNAQVWLLDRSKVALEWQGPSMNRTMHKRMVENRGNQQQTDENGVAVFPNVLNGALLVRHTGQWGWKEWIGPVANPMEVKLEPEVELLVEVVDAAGKPVPQVPIAIGHNYPNELRTVVKRSTSAPTGIASFRGITPKLKSQRNSIGYAVGFAFPTSDNQVVEIDPDNLPDEPIRLTLPPATRLIVKVVDQHGEPIKERFSMSMGVMEHTRNHLGEHLEIFRVIDTRRITGGSTRFEFVEQGVPITFKISGLRDRRDMTFTEIGPSANVDLNEMTLVWSDVFPHVFAKAMRADGEIMANAGGRVHIVVDGSKKESISFRADDEGIFKFAVRDPWVSPQSRAASIVIFQEGEQFDSEADLSFDPSIKGSSLGTLMFRVRPILASGTVLNASGPLSGAMVRAQELGPDNKWKMISDARSVTREQGDFLVRGTSKGGNLRLVVTAPQHKTAYRDGIGGGTLNIQVTLEEGMDEPSVEKLATMKGGEEWQREQKRGVHQMTEEQMVEEAQRRREAEQVRQNANREMIAEQKRAAAQAAQNDRKGG